MQAALLDIENRKLHFILTREIGEEIPVAKILEEGTKWRGRSEQIIALKEQIKQMKAAQV